jgi:hypothetical protein
MRLVAYSLFRPNEPVEKITLLKTASPVGLKIGNYFLSSKVLQSLVQCSYFHDILLTIIPYHPIRSRSRQLRTISMYFK